MDNGAYINLLAELGSYTKKYFNRINVQAPSSYFSTFPLPDILINLSDLHCNIIPDPDIRPVQICLLPPLCNCAKREALG